MYKIWSMWKITRFSKNARFVNIYNKGLSEVTTRLRKEGKEVSKDVNHLITINLFTTITNANFDDEVFYQRVKETLATKESLLAKLDNKENLSEAALWNAASNEEMDAK